MHNHDRGPNLRDRYVRFVVMILTSTLVMYVLTYTNVFDVAHIRISGERGYMAVVMGAAMAIVMMGFMWRMYPNVRINLAIVGTAALLGVGAFVGSQTQAFIGDVAYMNAMIPHHSIAILTSERATIRDLRVQALAQGISDTQVREIAEMKWLVDDISANGLATTREEAAARPVPDFSSR
jgi:hypothetical protein